MTSANPSRASKRAADAVYARVQADGSLRCADALSSDVMRKKKIRRGDLVRLVVSKPRNYGQWKKAHALGTLIAQNIEEFEQFLDEQNRADAHGALKHLQRLSGVECDDFDLVLELGEIVMCRTPRSLAFDEIDETRFQAAYSGFCAYLKRRWWTTLEEWQIEDMAKLVGDGG